MRTHTFRPEKYFNTIGPHEPVLQVQPGDLINTITIDAHGEDENGIAVASGPNPQTGPFYVEGAEPGDVLVVHFDRITPNRVNGWSYPQIAANVLDPDYLIEPSPRRPEDQSVEKTVWTIDLPAWKTTLSKPETRLGQFSLPLAPFLGCFGVAPENRQAISTATSGGYGGNMDYRGFVAGTTAYLPVSEPGGLFFLGDGHAVQGDGEIGGTGVEISMEVELRLDLIKGKTIAWPRGENDEFIFTLGNARPLDQALQHATTEMVRWLISDWGMDKLSAEVLLSQTVQYEVGNVFDPAYTMVCKVHKRWLTNQAG